MFVLIMALVAVPLHSEPATLWQSGVLHGVAVTLAVILAKAGLAAIIDWTTLRAMFLPRNM